MHKIIFFFQRKIKKKYVCLLKFSDPLPETHLFFIRPQLLSFPTGAGHKHRTDTGWYGKGVYFSEYPSYSMGYIQGATKLLLSQVLPGKVFVTQKTIPFDQNG